jgi:23S rRNA (pseudouridine1915-N3)-methyltransferase
LRVVFLAVGRPGTLLRDAIAEYERRAARYFSFETVEVRAEKAVKNASEEWVREQEGERLLERLLPGTETIALTRQGTAWDSAQLARHLQQWSLESRPSVTFLIGGALGLGRNVLRQATRQLSLSSCTLPHDLARLLLTEQLYRAGTIMRGEPYHKARP